MSRIVIAIKPKVFSNVVCDLESLKVCVIFQKVVLNMCYLNFVVITQKDLRTILTDTLLFSTAVKQRYCSIRTNAVLEPKNLLRKLWRTLFLNKFALPISFWFIRAVGGLIFWLSRIRDLYEFNKYCKAVLAFCYCQQRLNPIACLAGCVSAPHSKPPASHASSLFCMWTETPALRSLYWHVSQIILIFSLLSLSL